MQYIDNNTFNNHILSAPQQLQQGQGYPQSPQQAMSHQQNMQSNQQNERDQRQYEQEQMMLQQANNAFYASAAQNSANMQGMMFSGSNQQSSPHAFQWPPSSPAQHQQPQQGQTRMDGNLGGGSMFQNDLSFSPSTYYNASQADAEIEAILSNYRPKMMSDMHTYDTGTKENVNHASSSQQVAPASQMREGKLSGSSSASADRAGGSTKKAGQIDSKKAAAAAAAYGHFNYQSGSTSDQATSGQWNNVKTATSKGPSSTGGLSSGLDFQSSHSGGRGKYGSTGAEDADASNTSSAQTPGGVSSGEDSLNGKRRRMTAGGGISGKEQQERFESGQSTGGIDGKGASMTQSVVGGARPIMQHHSASLVDSRELEKIAQETLLRASQENARGSSTLSAALRKAPVRPTITHRKSQSGPNVSASMSGSQTSIQTVVDTGPPASPHRRPTGSGHTSALSMGGSHSFHQLAPSMALGAYATSQAPGLGGPILRTPSDLTVNSAHGATEFTKRKGWPTRIVEELLDFVHVLDREGKVLFASPSVLTLTGWRAEELLGRDLTDFIHPDDQSSVRLEFEKSLRKRSEMTMYYRFRRKPQTASDKQRVHDQRVSQQVSRSRSGSTSGGDTSSAPDSLNGQTKGKSTTFATGALDNHLAGVGLDSVDEEGEFQDDHRDKYVIFEATGHPYISPDDTLLDSELKEDLVEQLLPQVMSQGVKKESPDRPEQGSSSSALDVQCFFCSCRIYPTKNVGMLDSFLELKLENERLRTLLSELSVSEGPGHNAALDGASDGRRSLDEAPAGYHLDYEHDGDQQHHEILSSNQVGGHTQGGGAQNGMGGSAGFASSYTGDGRRESLVSAGPMSHPTSPLTAQSLEKNAENHAAMADDAEEPTSPNILTAEERRRRKKTKPEEGDYVCTDCGRVDSPEWRKGPLGPKTLCNACGLRWAKKVKRNGGDPNAIAMAANPAKGQIQAQAAAARAHQQNLHFQQQDNVGESLRSVGHTGLTTSDMSGVVQQQSNTGAYPSHSPPNHFDGNSFNSMYGGDPSAMAHLGSQAAFLQSRGMSYGSNTMQQPHQSNYNTHMN